MFMMTADGPIVCRTLAGPDKNVEFLLSR